MIAVGVREPCEEQAEARIKKACNVELHEMDKTNDSLRLCGTPNEAKMQEVQAGPHLMKVGDLPTVKQWDHCTWRDIVVKGMTKNKL